MTRSTRVVGGVLALIVVVLGYLIFRDVLFPSASKASSLNLYTVSRRTVTASVTGTGTLVPMAQVNVSFKVSGVLEEVDVKVGDKVKAGQVLARIDSTAEQNAVQAAQANLLTAQANLQAAQQPLTADQIAQLQHSLQTAQQSYNDTVTQVNFTNTQDTTAVNNDQTQLTNDTQALNNSATYQQDKQNLTGAKNQLQTDTTKFNTDGCQSQTYPYSGLCIADFTAVSTDQSAVNTDQNKVNADQTQVNADQNKLNQDTTKQQQDQISGQRSEDQGAASVTNAQDAINTQTVAKPNQVASAQAGLAQAQAALATAQQNLAATTLAAPMDGNVNSINGVVGETVGPGSGVTPQAPGTSAPLPTAAAANAFMVIGNTSAMEAVVPFAEPDAAKLSFNQDATVTFDAVSSLTISGKVLAVASNATQQSGVVNYYVTVALNRTSNQLKEGMTANASVVVQAAQNALTVPNLAVTHLGGLAYVNLYSKGQTIQTQIQTGVVGDQFTEVTGGVNEGDQVVIPSLRVPTSTGGSRGNPGGGVRIGG